MKKLSVVLVLLLVSMVTYGATGHWEDDGDLPATWMTTGNVGIGTSSPLQKLDVAGNIQIPNGNYMIFGGSSIKRRNATYGGLTFYCDQGPVMTMSSSSLGIGTEDPEYPLHVKSSAAKMVLESTSSKWWMYARSADGSLRFKDLNENALRMMIDSDGNIGIGTDDPQSELAVNGTITTKRVMVTETGWSDFVFADDYKLMPLSDLSRYIKTNKSLPGIPTEKEVVEKGVDVGNMQAKFLEKIEELTLYMIELKKDNEELRKTNEHLERRISALEK